MATLALATTNTNCTVTVHTKITARNTRDGYRGTTLHSDITTIIRTTTATYDCARTTINSISSQHSHSATFNVIASSNGHISSHQPVTRAHRDTPATALRCRRTRTDRQRASGS
jgi:hypothetical protein